MLLIGKTIGIWGFGVVGRSAAQFFSNRGARVVIYDDNDQADTSPYLRAPMLQALFDATDSILPSPGIDTRSYRSVYQGQWLCELDIFAQFFTKPVIAITGSVGKTTVTHLLCQVLKNQGIKAVAAGNIGTPMLSIIADQDAIEVIVLELSSFQLEYNNLFAPSLAIITNVYPNHLDRHGTMQEYFDAKYNLLRNQKPHQHALVPYAMKEQILQRNPKSSLGFFSPECVSDESRIRLFCHDILHKKFHMHGSDQEIDDSLFPRCTYLVNWLAIWAACHLFNVKLTAAGSVNGLEHRLEMVGSINGMVYINDSKSTTPTSTLSAVQQFDGKKLLLLLGGLSKGIDKTDMIREIAKRNVEIICFGKEAEQIAYACKGYNIKTQSCHTLQEAFAATLKNPIYDYVLFSPSGTSYDLFKDYIERGNIFKNLVRSHLS